MGTVVYATANGRVLSETRNGSRRFYSLDPLGNTRALYDNTQTKTDTFDYFPSGTVASRTGTTPTPFQWNGGSGYYRDNSKRTHVRARNFNVNLGRWQEPDPIGFGGGDFNLYRYVNNRFAVMTDPSGLVIGACLVLEKHIVKQQVYYKDSEGAQWQTKGKKEIKRTWQGSCPENPPFSCVRKCQHTYTGYAQQSRHDAEQRYLQYGQPKLWRLFHSKSDKDKPLCEHDFKSHALESAGSAVVKSATKFLGQYFQFAEPVVDLVKALLEGKSDSAGWTTSSNSNAQINVNTDSITKKYDIWQINTYIYAEANEYQCSRIPDQEASGLWWPNQLWDGGSKNLSK